MGTGITFFHKDQKPSLFEVAELLPDSPFRQAAIVGNPAQARKNIASIVVSKAAQSDKDGLGRGLDATGFPGHVD